MKRLFVAVDISEKVKDKIKPLLDSLKELDCDLKIVPLQNIHLTLKFLGEVDRSEIRKIEDKLVLASKRFSRFKIKMEKVGSFPSMERINSIWIGVDSTLVSQLMKDIDEELKYIRGDEHEEIPHLTIARVKTGRNKGELQKLFKKYEDDVFGEMVVDKIILYESELRPEGPVYSKVREFELLQNDKLLVDDTAGTI